MVDSTPLAAEVATRLVHALREAIPGALFAVELEDGFGREAGWGEDWSPIDPGALEADALELITGPVIKLLVRHPTLPFAEVAERARRAVGDDAVATWAGLRLVEISAAGVTKAFALERLCRRLGIAASEVVAVGDMPNDLAMLAGPAPRWRWPTPPRRSWTPPTRSPRPTPTTGWPCCWSGSWLNGRAFANARRPTAGRPAPGRGRTTRKVKAPAVGPWRASSSRRSLAWATVGMVPAGTHHRARYGSAIRWNHRAGGASPPGGGWRRRSRAAPPTTPRPTGSPSPGRRRRAGWRWRRRPRSGAARRTRGSRRPGR